MHRKCCLIPEESHLSRGCSTRWLEWMNKWTAMPTNDWLMITLSNCLSREPTFRNLFAFTLSLSHCQKRDIRYRRRLETTKNWRLESFYLYSESDGPLRYECVYERIAYERDSSCKPFFCSHLNHLLLVLPLDVFTHTRYTIKEIKAEEIYFHWI